MVRKVSPDPWIFGILIACLLVGGCTVGPDYAPPAPREDLDRWHQLLEYGLVPAKADIGRWWQALGDPQLDTLIQRGLSGNLDLFKARSRVREARAARGIETAARFPSLSGSGAATAARQGDQPAGELYSAGFDATWEIDLFGRVSRSIEAADADRQAAVEALRGVEVSLAAEIAINYVEIRATQQRLRVAEANLEAQAKTLRIVTDRYDLQLAGALEVEQATANLAAGRARMPPIKAERRRATNRLAVLVGEKPGVLEDFFQDPAEVPMAPPRIAVGIPADLLRRRPDIRRAERELAAQSARVGVAVADLYPRFAFNGTLQFSADDSGDLFDSSSRRLAVGPAFQWHLFNAGSVRNRIRIQNERQQQALLQYEQTVLQAIEDAENALTAYSREVEREAQLTRAAAAARNAVQLAESLYLHGLRDFLYVLDAQRALLDLEDHLAQSRAAVTANLIRLYKALGGGWRPASGDGSI